MYQKYKPSFKSWFETRETEKKTGLKRHIDMKTNFKLMTKLVHNDKRLQTIEEEIVLYLNPIIIQLNRFQKD